LAEIAERLGIVPLWRIGFGSCNICFIFKFFFQ
jgi:hypothetical protein